MLPLLLGLMLEFTEYLPAVVDTAKRAQNLGPLLVRELGSVVRWLRLGLLWVLRVNKRSGA